MGYTNMYAPIAIIASSQKIDSTAGEAKERLLLRDNDSAAETASSSSESSSGKKKQSRGRAANKVPLQKRPLKRAREHDDAAYRIEVRAPLFSQVYSPIVL